MVWQRVIGLETEFGIIDADNMQADPAQLCEEIVQIYRKHGDGVPSNKTIWWDYRSEDPLNDARGYRLARQGAHASQLTDALAFSQSEAVLFDTLPTLHALPAQAPSYAYNSQRLNTVLLNGGRFYVDHAHPEYSAPEVANPYEAIVWDRAGELIARQAMQLLQNTGKNYVLYKNNVDGKGAAYGTHENYLVSRKVDFTDIVRYLTPFFVSRQVLCGAGRVGLGQKSQQSGFQISQRADYVENEVGLETTFNRPIINTRDEPHAVAQNFRRLHVIGGDANQFDVSNLLKIGTTNLVLWLLEQPEIPLELESLMLYEPVPATWEISHDPTLQVAVEMHDDTTMTALNIQEVYHAVVAQALEKAGVHDADIWQFMQLWRATIDDLATDITKVATKVEWVAKYLMMQGLQKRVGNLKGGRASWDSDALRALDLQWHDLRPQYSIVQKLVQLGQVTQLVSDAQAQAAVLNAPTTTRAYLRGGLMQKFAAQVVATSWRGITVAAGRDATWQYLDLPDPTKAEQDTLADMLESSSDLAQFLEKYQDLTTKH